MCIIIVPAYQAAGTIRCCLAGDLAASLGLNAFYASDLLRARQTAAPIAEAFGLPVHIEPKLREIHQGEWQGLLVFEIETHYERVFHLRLQNPWSIAPPGSETAMQMRFRVEAAAFCKNQPMKTYHSPLKKLPQKTVNAPSAMKPNAINCPAPVAIWVARKKLPVSF